MSSTWSKHLPAVLLAIFIVSPASAAAPAPPTNLTAQDAPNDAGNAIDIAWELSPDDSPSAEDRRVISYLILRQEGGDGEFTQVGDATLGTSTFRDGNCERGKSYLYQVVAVAADGSQSAPVATSQAATPVLQWFDWGRAWFGVVLLVLCGSVMLFIQMARGGRVFHMRQIAGLAAVEDAVGRATEMGRSVLFIVGIQDMNDIQTVAGITVLSRVAKVAAEHDANLEVPTCRSLVMMIARETVQAAYLAAGRPDAYKEDNIYYVTDEQFGYVAAVSGLMVREKPAACLYMGAFYAESLILAETGNAIGAIQVAGTAMPAQLPFFVAACDYTLIGEEFFAASAYLSGEPQQMGSLKGQDMGKIIVAALIVVGTVAATLHAMGVESAGAVVDYLMNTVLQSSG